MDTTETVPYGKDKITETERWLAVYASDYPLILAEAEALCRHARHRWQLDSCQMVEQLTATIRRLLEENKNIMIQWNSMLKQIIALQTQLHICVDAEKMKSGPPEGGPNGYARQ